ncbi:MAG: hypothetical protein A2W23_09125 [Planctomycetes bacterium RBG_16_43_13]|nr:MAG: hypothetical protein A2W23_09125 [Planctomycetes bacterium RBG_16_43_13]
MTSGQAMAEVFVTAFKHLPKRLRKEVIEDIIKDRSLYEDLCDTIIAKQRIKEKGRPLEEFEAELRQRRRI